jgi:hypothetical protein
VDFKLAVKYLNTTLKQKDPLTFSSSWIYKYCPRVYRYAYKNIRTEHDTIDWDLVTSEISRKFQKRWIRYGRKIAKSYENQNEVDIILEKYKNNFYTLIVATNDNDRNTRNRIIVSFVRISQKGNILAQIELIKWLRYITDEWIEKHWQLKKWKGYTDDIEDKMRGCIRGYRYTGSFLGYLFKTLEYSARGMCYLEKYSFDDPVLDGAKTKIDYFVQEY